MKFPLLTVIAASVIFGCSQPGSKTEEASAVAPNDTIAAAVNAGEQQVKWEANPETTAGIVSMQSLLGKVTPAWKDAEFEKLRTDLRAEFDGILKKCTMKGPAHEALHEYLTPLPPMIDSVGSRNVQTRSGAISELNTHLSAFSEKFR